MRIIIGSDHRGFNIKQRLVKLLEQANHQVTDAGAFSSESSDYPDFAFTVAGAVGRGECERGILICGTGIGMSIAANKVHGVRAAPCHDIVTAEMGIPANTVIHLLMHSKDVGHSFYVPELRVQQDFVPGLDLSVHFKATKIGRYEIVCTQLCGLGHYNMKAYLSVMSQEDFDRWLKQQAANQ